MEFHLIAAGEGEKDGIDTSFQSYKSSDGATVLFLTQIFGAEKLAHAMLEERILKATEIIDKNVKLDIDGKVIGDRVAILFYDATDSSHERAAILWIQKSDLLVIETDFMSHALAFEKKFCR